MHTGQNGSEDRIKRRGSREADGDTGKTSKLEVLESSSPDTIYNMLIAEKKTNKLEE